MRRRNRPSVLPLRPIDEARAEFSTSLSLRNACVAFHDDEYSQHRAHVVVDGPLLSPIVVHGFSERASGYVRLTSVRRAETFERNGIQMCWRAPLGLGVPVSHASSIYHQLFHAVPSWLALRERVAAAGLSDDAPAAAFVPLFFADAALGHGKPAAPRRWYAWEFSIRPLTRTSGADIAAAAARLLRAPCTCFERFEAESRAFNPGALASAATVRLFRDAALRHAPPPPLLPALGGASTSATGGPGAGSTSRSARSAGWAAAVTALRGGERRADLLLVSRQGERRGGRQLSNEGEVLARLRGLPAAPRLARVVLEGLPLAEQMRLVAAASVLIAVHGQALAWLAFLPSDVRPTGVVEVSIMTKQGALNPCYQAWSAALSVQYWRVAGRLAPGCNGGATSRDDAAQRAHKLLACNVSVDAAQLAGTVSAAAAATARVAGR